MKLEFFLPLLAIVGFSLYSDAVLRMIWGIWFMLSVVIIIWQNDSYED